MPTKEQNQTFGLLFAIKYGWANNVYRLLRYKSLVTQKFSTHIIGFDISRKGHNILKNLKSSNNTGHEYSSKIIIEK